MERKNFKDACVKQIVTAVTTLLTKYEEQAMEKALKLASDKTPMKLAKKASPKKISEARKLIAKVDASKAKKKPVKAKKIGAELKPCPVTGILNKHRRFSYLMPEARTPENLAKFKGAAKASSKASA